jgi:hypothetical protein
VNCDACSGSKRARTSARSGTATKARAATGSFGPNRVAAEQTIDALRLAGHLEPVDATRIAQLRAIASAVDLDPTNAALHREFRLSEASLRLSGAGAAEVDSYAQLMHKLGGDQ